MQNKNSICIHCKEPIEFRGDNILWESADEGDKKGAIKAGGVILQFKNQAGLNILLEDINRAIDSKWSVE